MVLRRERIWRRWFADGQAIAVVRRRGVVGLRVLIVTDDHTMQPRVLRIGLGAAVIHPPLGLDRSHRYGPADCPSWGVERTEFGLRWYRGLRSGRVSRS